MMISSYLGETGHGPLGSTFPFIGSIPHDLKRKASNSPCFPTLFKTNETRFRIKGTKVAEKLISVPSLSKIIKRQGIRLP